MKEWVATTELAAALRVSLRAIQLRISNESWPTRRASTGRRGQPAYEVAVAALPEDIRIVLALQQAEEPSSHPHAFSPSRGGSIAAAVVSSPLPSSGDTTEARAFILGALDRFQVEARVAIGHARDAFIAAWNSGTATAPQLVRDLYPVLSLSTLRRWERQRAKAGAAGLVDRRAQNRKGKGLIDSDDALRDFIVTNIQARPHITALGMMKAVEARFERPINLRTLQHWMARYRTTHAVELAAIANPDGARSRYLPAFGDAGRRAFQLNQLWEMDSTPADVMLHGGRHSIIGVIDVYSRRAMVLVSRTSKATAVTALLRKAILAWGVPQVVKTDRGSDYVSRHMERALRLLGIRQELCQPFTPQSKPHIERFFGTLSHQLLELLPGYIGHSVADRKAIESRRAFAQRLGESDAGVFQVDLDVDGLQKACDTWTESVYAHDTHGQLGVSPFAAAAAWRGEVARIENERALDLLLHEAPDGDGIRVVGKKGIQVDRVTYIAGELGAHVGARVHVRLDPEDIGRIYVYDAEGTTFLCRAEAPEITGISRRAVANEAKQRHRQVHAAFRAKARERAKEVRPEGIAEEILRHAAAKTGGIVALPAPAVLHETPAIAAAAEAAAASTPQPLTQPTPDEQEAAHAVMVQLGSTGGSVEFDFEALRRQRLKRLAG